MFKPGFTHPPLASSAGDKRSETQRVTHTWGGPSRRTPAVGDGANGTKLGEARGRIWDYDISLSGLSVCLWKNGRPGGGADREKTALVNCRCWRFQSVSSPSSLLRALRKRVTSSSVTRASSRVLRRVLAVSRVPAYRRAADLSRKIVPSSVRLFREKRSGTAPRTACVLTWNALRPRSVRTDSPTFPSATAATVACRRSRLPRHFGTASAERRRHFEDCRDITLSDVPDAARRPLWIPHPQSLPQLPHR